MTFHKKSKNEQDLSFIPNNKPQQFKLIFSKRLQKIIKIAGVITGITGLVLLFSSLQSYQTNQSVVSTTGTIIEIASTTTGHNDNGKWLEVTRYYPVVQFVDQQGQMQEFKADAVSSPAFYKKGDTVKVLYDSRDPKLAIIENGIFKHRNWLPLILGILGILLVLLGWKAIKRKYN